jgi:DNA modification methylase
LRDNGAAGQIGLEASPAAYLDALLSVFAAVARVLRDDGILWVNLGDTYAKPGRSTGGTHGPSITRQKKHYDAKEKELLGMPWRLAFALSDAGWYLRSEIIWHKPNAMTETATDRPGRAHEHLFMFTKSPRYYYDAFAVMEDGVSAPRNRRSVWRVSLVPLKAKHFSAFPPKLVEPCIKAATSAHGICAACGAGYVRLLQKTRVPTRPGRNTKSANKPDDKRSAATLGWNKTLAIGNRDPQRHITHVASVGWKKGCNCATNEIARPVVLDPFNGAGTTGLVALTAQCRYIGCDINHEYLAITQERLANHSVGGILYATESENNAQFSEAPQGAGENAESRHASGDD